MNGLSVGSNLLVCQRCSRLPCPCPNPAPLPPHQGPPSPATAHPPSHPLHLSLQRVAVQIPGSAGSQLVAQAAGWQAQAQAGVQAFPGLLAAAAAAPTPPSLLPSLQPGAGYASAPGYQ